MDFQVVEIQRTAVQRKSRIIGVILQAALWTLFMFFWERRVHRFDAHPVTWTGEALPGIVAGTLYGLLIYFVPLQKLFGAKKNRPARVGIRIGPNEIASVYQSPEGTTWIPQAVVHKGMVRSIFKIPGGIGVSERSQFGARMLGFVVIPKTLPKFDEVRALVESWRVSEA